MTRYAALLCLTALVSPAIAEGIAKPRPVTDADYREVDEGAARLGQLLFYDPILSGNQEVSCATCHHPRFGTGDGLSLPLGDGGTGLGPDRVADPENLPEQRVPRNAQALFNLGAHEFTVLFHDGRIEALADGTLRTPLDADMVKGFDTILSAQTMFPVLSPDEMAGHYGENEVSSAVRRGELTGEGGAWDLIAARVAAVPEYAAGFAEVYGLAADEIGFTDISNAVAAFMEFEWRSDSALFDAWLRGEADLAGAAAEGAALFYGEAGCASCHAGPFLTDHDFHAMGDVQIGPGKARRFESHARDPGRFGVTGHVEDLYAFRTPSLRNVELTAPYGHAGAFADLGAYVAAHVGDGWAAFDPGGAVLPALEVDDLRIAESAAEVEAIRAARETSVSLEADEVAAIVAFLKTLTDPVAVEGRLGVPERVPSGAEVAK